MVKKPKLYLDMDNTLVDTLPILTASAARAIEMGFDKPDQIPDIFRNLKPLSGVLTSVQTLSEYYDLYILSTAPWFNASSWSNKIEWLNEYFGNDEQSPFYKRVIMTHDKGLARAEGGILIDDRPYHGAAKWEDEAGGTAWIQFDYNEKMNWIAEDGLMQLLIQTAQIYQAQSVTEREALIQASQAMNLSFHGSLENFEKENWE